MGKSETSTNSIGIKILISDLITQINTNNIDIIKEILFGSFISDCNEHYNDAFEEIILCNELPEKEEDCKVFLEKEFKKKGSYIHVRNSSKIESDLTNGCLWEKELLFPIKDILRTDRFGYDRYGKNGTYRPIDFDLSVDVTKYKDIENFTIVFILRQYSG